MLRTSLLTFVVLLGCTEDPSAPDAKPAPVVDGSVTTSPSTTEAGTAADASAPNTTADATDADPRPDAGRDSSAPAPSGPKQCAPLFSVHSKDSSDAASGLCDDVPPECDSGTVAELYTVDGYSRDCWTGRCLPARECDLVNDCRDCAADTYCYITDDEGNSWRPPGVDPAEFDGQNLIRVECKPLTECSDDECDCEEVFCHGGCGNGPLGSEYDNEYTESLVEHSDGAFICETYDG